MSPFASPVRDAARFVLAAALLASCASEPPLPELPTRDASWGSFVTTLQRSHAPVALLEERRAERGLPLIFRVRGAELREEDRERVRTHRSCGEMLPLFVREIPPAEPGRVSGEEVLELDGSGSVIQRWTIPPDRRVAGIEGDELLVPHSVRLPDRRRLATFLRIRPDGAFRITAPDRPTPAEPFACPQLAVDGERSLPPQHRCWRYDAASGPRLLAYEGSCLAVRS